MRYLTVPVLVLVLLGGCLQSRKKATRMPIGKITAVDYIQGGWAQSQKTVITTEDGLRWFGWKGHDSAYQVFGGHAGAYQ